MSMIEATKQPSNGVATVSSWVGAAIHTITLPSGSVVKIRFPDLSRLIRDDLLPEDLRAAALRQAFDDLELAEPVGDGSTSVDEETRKKYVDTRFRELKRTVQLMDGLIVQMLVEPELTAEQVGTIPGEDRDMLLAIAQRQRATDARGVRVGVAPLDLFQEFRELHGCVDKQPEGCEACQALQQRFSTADLGRV